ncbi:ABC transporter substrate-binding protein [Pseudomonas sp.]|uniref:substrate-binding periplasmic protein n=1 Tax=Pseudomonas sp. TaxID=306 RepID=UPI0027326108|nr:transporter substrate-binding domain-containing protein [Pseudomonas sp.]MDP3814290.1 transporter substrate-binding domain-containing protein [Pseudomonas sp.]
MVEVYSWINRAAAAPGSSPRHGSRPAFAYLALARLVLALLCLGGALPSQAAEPRHITVYAYHLKPPFIVDQHQEQGLYYDFSAFLNSKGDAYRFRTQFVPRNRVEHDLAHQRFDGVLLGVNPIWFQDQAEKKYLWTPGIFEDQDEIVSLIETRFDYQGPQSLIGKKLGGVLGFSYFGVDTLAAKGHIARINTVGEREVLEMLLKGRVDAGIVSRSTLNYLVAREGWQGRFYLSRQPHDTFSRRVLVLRRDQELYDYLLPILQGLQTDKDWQAILRKYQ